MEEVPTGAAWRGAAVLNKRPSPSPSPNLGGRPRPTSAFNVPPPRMTTGFWRETAYGLEIERQVREELTTQVSQLVGNLQQELRATRGELVRERAARVDAERRLLQKSREVEAARESLCSVKVFEHIGLKAMEEAVKVLYFSSWHTFTVKARCEARLSQVRKPDRAECLRELQELRDFGAQRLLQQWNALHDEMALVADRHVDLDSYIGGCPRPKKERPWSSSCTTAQRTSRPTSAMSSTGSFLASTEYLRCATSSPLPIPCAVEDPSSESLKLVERSANSLCAGRDGASVSESLIPDILCANSDGPRDTTSPEISADNLASSPAAAEVSPLSKSLKSAERSADSL